MSPSKFWRKLALFVAALFATSLGNTQSVLSKGLRDDDQHNIVSRLEKVRETLKSKYTEGELQHNKEKSEQRVAQWGNWGNGWGNWDNYWGNY